VIHDSQIKRLRRLLSSGKTLAEAALRAGISEKSARKYRDMDKLPSQTKQPRTYRTRRDPLEPIWGRVEELLRENPGLQSTTVLEWLGREYPGEFDESHLRTLQRRMRQWRATAGPAKEVFFKQVHHPGDLAGSDFTDMRSLDVKIAGQRLDHLVYHFVLTYSNWEAITVCYSESFESLSQGLQNAFQRLGGVPRRHRTDRLSAAVNNQCDPREFTERYQQLMKHYGIAIEKTQPSAPHENGDAESAHRGFKTAVDQALMLRGKRDFASLGEYQEFLQKLVDQRNASRGKRLAEEMSRLRVLPERRLEDYRVERVRVNSGSLIQVQRNTYSVHSRMIGEQVEARIHMDHIEIWYAQKCVDRFPRLRGRDKYSINYRHVIDWLVRKPGAFAGYQYQESLYPTIRFRMAYDHLRTRHGEPLGTKNYLAILELAARESQSRVDEALGVLLESEEPWTAESVAGSVHSGAVQLAAPTAIEIEPVSLSVFDGLLESAGSLEEAGDAPAPVEESCYPQPFSCVVLYDEVLAQR
jgi:hypothetical protein